MYNGYGYADPAAMAAAKSLHEARAELERAEREAYAMADEMNPPDAEELEWRALEDAARAEASGYRATYYGPKVSSSGAGSLFKITKAEQAELDRRPLTFVPYRASGAPNPQNGNAKSRAGWEKAKTAGMREFVRSMEAGKVFTAAPDTIAAECAA